MRSILTVALCSFLVPLTAQAADSEGKFTVKGVGLASCERFVAEREKNSELAAMFAGWLDGYLSAINQIAPETYDVTAWEATGLLLAFIEDHCKENPDVRFFTMANALAGKLMEDRVKTQSPLMDAKAGDQSVKIYKEALRRAQQALKQKGFYNDSVDGVFGPNTQKAFEAFQRKENIRVTGVPDQMTMLKLLRP